MSGLKSMLSESNCDVRFDDLTRQLFATDASIYQIVPECVAFPRSSEQAVSAVNAAAACNVPIIPRGAGTGLAGGAIGSGMVVDFSRHNHAISDLQLEEGTVRVEAGVVLDQLNAFLKPHGLRFGPDVATSSRATLGGMIANNSSGSHAPVYGTTADHVISLDILLADGRVVTVGRGEEGLREIGEEVARLVRANESSICEHMPEGLLKRWPGYGFDRWLRDRSDLTRIISGSEGTLATILSARLHLSPVPKRKGIGAIFFATVSEAMAATVEILDLGPAAIEHIDDVLFDQTRGQLNFKRARTLLRLDEEPCESILLVEFFEEIDDKLAALNERSLGMRNCVFTDESDMEQIWSLRKAGLSLLTGRPGDAKPTAGIEDVAVMPERLPEYVAGLKALMAPLGLKGSFYGHAASGLLHVRPLVDLHNAGDLAKYRALADEVSLLVKEFKGSIAAEHGVGIARTAYLADHIGPELYEATKKIKALFDPANLMNPGKIISNDEFSIDTHLRQGAENIVSFPYEPMLAFAAKDHSFVGNLEQCNGCGGCRKATPTMCPTFAVTGEEIMSTRGRANTIRALLEGRLGEGDPFPAELSEALDACLSCKACTMECPSNVNMTLLKAELLYQRQELRGLKLGDRLISRVDILGTLASLAPRLTNAFTQSQFGRKLLERTAGLSAKRPLPRYAAQRFDRTFARRESRPAERKVILWDDCFVRYNEPSIGMAAAKVLESAGYQVVLPTSRACCGRPAFSMGRLDVAKEMGSYNIQLLSGDEDTPIIFLEPSCFSMFAEDYRELGLDSDGVAQRAVLFEQFMHDELDRDSLRFDAVAVPVAIHAHCHAKALTDTSVSVALAQAATNGEVKLLNTGCCGMAGAFGAMTDRYELSLKIAAPLVDQLDALSGDTTVIASGTSCRHQVQHLTERQPLHMAEFLASALPEE